MRPHTVYPKGYCGLIGNLCKPSGGGQSRLVVTTLIKKPIYLVNQPVSQADKYPQPPQLAMVTDLLSCANCPPTLIRMIGYMTVKTCISSLGAGGRAWSVDGLVCLQL